MSHISTIKTSVSFKNADLLQQALENIPGGTVGTEITDYYGNTTTVEMAVKTDQFQRGIGFDKVGGEIYEPRMDKYGYESAGDTLLNQVQTQYRKFAVTAYYESKGYAVEVEDTSPEEAQIHIRGY